MEITDSEQAILDEVPVAVGRILAAHPRGPGNLAAMTAALLRCAAIICQEVGEDAAGFIKIAAGYWGSESENISSARRGLLQ
jgi:hypothetical protein